MADPLPPFPGFSWATADKASQSERAAVANANGALRAFGGEAITSLRDLTIEETRLLATFPELDHYGERETEHYIGPLLGQLPNTRLAVWPKGGGPKIFACVRPDTSHVQVILEALTTIDARVVCMTPGFTEQQLAPFRQDHVLFAVNPVNLAQMGRADLCISYGAEGTMMTFLLEGTPQLISPWHVETFMAGRKLEAAGFGRSLETEPTLEAAKNIIENLAKDLVLRERVAAFARLHRKVRGNEPLPTVVDFLHREPRPLVMPQTRSELRRGVNVERAYEQTKSAGFSGETLLSQSCQESVATR